MSIKYKIGIWGQFGGEGHVLADGQAVRTTIISNELIERYGAENVIKVNTHNWKKRPLAFLYESLRLIAVSRNILFLPADNGFKVFAPILALCNLIFRRKLIYIVIGGFLPNLLKEKRAYLWIVKQMNTLYVQTENLRQDLKSLGIERIKILSNLKRLNSVKESDICINNEKSISVCVFSRLIKEKGIEDAIEAVKKANEILKTNCISMDMYGVVPKSYSERFDELLKDNSNIVSYKGILDYDKTVETLKNYFALLFPTYYYGEGFPGNVVDAYNSALPIIATDWMYNSDVIKDKYNGLLVKPKSPEEICDAILQLYNNREYVHQIRLNNINEAKQYHPDIVLKDLYSELESAK